MHLKNKWESFSYSWKKKVGGEVVVHMPSDVYQKLLFSADIIFSWNEFFALTCQAPYVSHLADTQAWLLKSGEIQFPKISSKAELSSKFLDFPWWGKQSNMMNKMWGAKYSGK